MCSRHEVSVHGHGDVTLVKATYIALSITRFVLDIS